jgi:hypothetical protein
MSGDDVDRAILRRALEPFDQEVLERAWDRVVRDNPLWCWPKLVDLAVAAEHFHRRAHPAGQADACLEQAVRLTDDYVPRFLKTLAQCHVGYDSGVLFGPWGRPEEGFFEKAGKQAQMGLIRVQVPARLVERWQQQACRPQGRDR